MAIFRRNTLIIIILLLLASCKSVKTTTSTEQTQERKETVIIQAPYSFSIQENLLVDKDGHIKPLKMKLKFNNTEGIVTIKNGIAKFSVENPDTLVVSREIVEKEKEKIVSDTVITKSPSWWSRFKTKVVLWSLILNVIFIGAKIYSLTRRVYLP